MRATRGDAAVPYSKKIEDLSTHYLDTKRRKASGYQ
jgi:hypothetical protein